MIDHYLRYVNCIQAWRRRASALTVGLGGALGVAADPLPHQIASVRRVLGDLHVRHLISDEVGLGKTVQALMIVNALRWQDSRHRTLVIAPDNLLSQWQEECWIRGHVMPGIAGSVGDFQRNEIAPVTLARPRDVLSRPGQTERTISLDATVFDLLIVDEPQTMTREAIQSISLASEEFRQVLVLSATPRLGDPAWRDPIMRMIEPEASRRARIEGRAIGDVLRDREEQAMAAPGFSEDQNVRTSGFLRAGAGRRIIRNGRADWSSFLPQRRNHEVRVRPLRSERIRHDIAAMLLKDADPGQGLQGPAWTAARALQRSARTARGILTELAARQGMLGKLAEEARMMSLEDPGDSRLDALLDILSEQWSDDEARKFIIVCGDNPTIDMLRVALPRYFPALAEAISVLRRPTAAEVEGVTNLREIQETLAPLLTGNSRLLLVGDWVQAGLNLHHVAQGIIFFSLPWEIDIIDQLIGRVDRLGGTSDRKVARLVVDIWRILIEDSQETAIADTVAALGVFDAPLAPMSPTELADLQETLGQAAALRKPAQPPPDLLGYGTSLPTLFAGADPFTRRQAVDAFERWMKQPCPAPAMMTERAHSRDTPVRREERAVGAWMKAIAASRDFDISYRRDSEDGYGFHTFWYHGTGERGRAGDGPFVLPGVSLENWMSGHVPFIYRRGHVSSPPRKSVFTDGGERSVDGAKSARPLRFMDYGDEVHDALVAGYSSTGQNMFGPEKPVVQTSVRLPEGHPARSIGSLVIIMAALLDPFPDELLPPHWSPAANAILTGAPTEVQKRALAADRNSLHALFRAMQRRARMAVPAEMMLFGSRKTENGWQEMSASEVGICLQPLTASTNNAIAKGRPPRVPLERPEVVNVVRRGQTTRLNSELHRISSSFVDRIRGDAEHLAGQLAEHFKAEIGNRELALERRRQTPPDGGLLELWQGQIAALDRSLSMARLNSAEASSFLENFSSGRTPMPSTQPISILLAFVADD
jgi:ATP-dependent helicase HepA